IGHWWSGFLVWLGSWLSGYFIVATDAWMQHPVAYRVGANGRIELASFWGLLLNKWALWQYAHTMLGAAQTGCFVMAAVGAFYLLTHRDEAYGRTFVKGGVLVGIVAAVLQLFPTGDMQGKLIATHQPVALAALQLWRRKLFESRWILWLLMLSVPLPYIANTAGWITAEVGRQPWLIYGLMRTVHGSSPRVSAGNVWFTLLGFMGMYSVLA